MAIKSRKRTIDLGSVSGTSQEVGADSYDAAIAIAASGTCTIEGSADGGTNWEQLPGEAQGSSYSATLLTPLIRVAASGPVDVSLCLTRVVGGM